MKLITTTGGGSSYTTFAITIPASTSEFVEKSNAVGGAKCASTAYH